MTTHDGPGLSPTSTSRLLILTLFYERLDIRNMPGKFGDELFSRLSQLAPNLIDQTYPVIFERGDGETTISLFNSFAEIRHPVRETKNVVYELAASLLEILLEYQSVFRTTGLSYRSISLLDYGIGALLPIMKSITIAGSDKSTSLDIHNDSFAMSMKYYFKHELDTFELDIGNATDDPGLLYLELEGSRDAEPVSLQHLHGLWQSMCRVHHRSVAFASELVRRASATNSQSSNAPWPPDVAATE
jgi:hypothetical protein